ncbi:hypothetical protein E3N88_10246 [Mikania micrantha]|uniref:Uncharacterized protein n=1 Tax=Mikania micrantha TaxID=192012 RepID=A0A5N6PA43_9ASTR|nr:hypothetical protein E3N88_10246 [Mikania micrantha]
MFATLRLRYEEMTKGHANIISAMAELLNSDRGDENDTVKISNWFTGVILEAVSTVFQVTAAGLFSSSGALYLFICSFPKRPSSSKEPQLKPMNRAPFTSKHTLYCNHIHKT